MEPNETNEQFNAMGRGNPFSVPDSYFDTFDQRVKQKIDSTERGTLHLLSTSKTWRLAVAAIFIGVLFAVVALLTKTQNTNLSKNAQQVQSDSDLAVASTELINTLKITSTTPVLTDSFLNSKKSNEITDVSEQEVIDYMLGNDVEPLLVDL